MEDKEKKLDELQDFMATISYWMLVEIEEKRKYKTDSEVLQFLIDQLKFNVSICPEAALEAKSYEDW